MWIQSFVYLYKANSMSFLTLIITIAMKSQMYIMGFKVYTKSSIVHFTHLQIHTHTQSHNLSQEYLDECLREEIQ